MNCNCKNNSSEVLRIVRGNAFSINIAIEAVRLDGSVVENFDLGASDAVLHVIHAGKKTEKEFIVDENNAIIAFDGTDGSGWYGLEMDGVYDAKPWRWCVENVFQLVETNEKANIPSWTFVIDSTYFVTGVMTLMSGDRAQADWAETNPVSASYIRNKPIIYTQSEVNALIQAEAQARQQGISNEATARQQADQTLQGNITAEATAREAADATLQGNITAEATAREAADATLQGNITAEATAREGADATLQGNITAEATDRIAADTALQGNINSEVTARESADSTLQGNINSEVTAREAADATLQGNITAEVERATAAEQVLQGSIADEVTRATTAEEANAAAITNESHAREDADTALSNRVTAIEGKIPDAATSNNQLADKAWVNTEYGDKADKVSGAVNGDFAGLDAHGNLADSGKKASDFATSAQGAKADTAYQKPSGGIPSTDMTSAVQTSLGKADTAYQKPSGGIPSTDMTSAVQTSLGKADTAYQKPSGGIPSADLSSAVQASLGKADTALQSQAQADWNESDTDAAAYIKNKPTIPVITGKADKVSNATNGDFAGLDSNGNLTDSGKKSSDFATAAQGAKADTAYQLPSGGIPSTDLASAVQTSLGKADTALQSQAQADWNESDNTKADYIKNKPTIPVVTGKADKVANATNGDFAGLDSNGNLTDSGKKASDFATAAQGALADAAAPQSTTYTKTEVDGLISGFVTANVNDLVNYYLKSETYTQAEVDALVASVQQFEYKVVSVLPTASAQTMGIIWLVPSPTNPDAKDSYVTIDNGAGASPRYTWEQIGSTDIDLSGYYTSAQTDAAITAALNSALANYTTTANLTTLLAGKQDVISDLATIRSGASAGATAYQKPSGGIPSTDLSSAVQTSLGKADTALQSQEQADWNESDNTKADYIKNKPTIPAAQVNSDWNASSGVAAILNKPTIPVVTGKADKVSNATNGDFAGLDSNGNLTDSGKKASDFATAAQGAKADTAYQLPSGGVPSTDLASAVQTSLGKADTAYQKPSGGIPSTDLASAVQTSLGKADTALQSQTQADWNESDTDAAAYIKNKPSIPAAQVNADWNASSGVAEILNKPTIPDVSVLASKVSGATNGDFAGLDASGNLTDSGKSASDFATASQGAKADTAYQKPSGGIPSTDLSSAVQTSLGKADTALQSQTQADWNVTNSSSAAYIKNKPTIPAAQVNADWNASSGVAQILNKPTIPTVNNATLTIQKNGTNVATFTANASSNVTANIEVPAAQVQSNWNETNTSSKAYIQNKPTIPAAQVNSDWNASSGVAQILNKPTIPAAQVNSDWNATSGVARILNKPTIPAAQVNSDWNAASGVAQILNKPNLSVYAEKVLVVDASTQPSSYAPNTVYELGTLTGTVTINPLASVQSTEAQVWCLTFSTGSTAPTITWPTAITGWSGGMAPTISASKHYELSVMDGIGVIIES